MNKQKNQNNSGKLPPNAIDIEEVVLGVFLSVSSSIINLPMLNEESFYKLEHRIIFQAINDLALNSQKIDILTVTMWLKKNDQLVLVGGPAAISRLTTKVVSDAHLEEYCHILIEHETARRQIKFGSELIQKAYDPTEDVFKTNEYMADQVHQISTRSVITKEIRNEDLANALIQRVHNASKNKGITGVPTGFKEHDVLLGGLQPGDLIILAARPSMGKTALALCYLRNSVVNHGKRMIFFSHEMSADQLFQRLVAIHMNLPANKFKRGEMSDGEWRYFNENLQPILDPNLIIVDDCQTLSQITMRAKKERMKGNLDGIIIDYLQLVSYPGIKVREQEVSAVSRGLKMLAKELNIPIVALSQLSRSVETRGGEKRPTLSDLRESGAIEQDADIVELLYRPNYYGKAEEGKEDLAELIIEKNRNGDLQTIDLRFDHKLTKFTDYNTNQQMQF